MASGPRKIHTFSGIDATTTVGISGYGAHGSASFFVDLTEGADGSTWDVALYWSPDATAGGGVKIAEVTGLIASGFVEITKDAAFASTRDAIPEPNLLVITESAGSGGDVSGTVYAFYGD